MKTDTQYLEPVGFSGTPGKWEGNNVIYTDKNMCPVPYFEISTQHWWIAHVNNSPKVDYDKGVGEANAKLISQSKELAKVLQDMIEWHSKHDGISFIEPELLSSAKQVLKDAGLTDK